MGMNRNQKIEDYMKTVWLLREQGIVRGAYIAKALGVTKPTVSVSLKEMEESGYLRILENRTVELTEKGEAIARRVIERSDLIFGLLTDLGVSRETALADAYNIEHGISDETFHALTELRGYLGYIRNTPFGSK